MRILIASDLHGSLDSLRFILNITHALNPDMLILLGDLVYHGPRNPLPRGYDTASVLSDMSSVEDLQMPVVAVRGNCDSEVDVNLLPFPMPESAWINADNLHIFASHGHRLPETPPLPGFLPGTVILRGHTHVPRAETVDGLHFWNPGSMSLPKSGYPASFGWYEDGLFRVLDLAGNELMRNRPGMI